MKVKLMLSYIGVKTLYPFALIEASLSTCEGERVEGSNTNEKIKNDLRYTMYTPLQLRPLQALRSGRTEIGYYLFILWQLP